ncbi:MAG TPA: alpha/beta family hydrolase [Hyphomonadaceae bacterium]|nr:alpha/beta family hydrolase [Hyphomonadaceae bacterium]
MSGRAVTIRIPGGDAVSGLWNKPKDAKAALVLAHGAGAGITHRHMEATAEGLAERGIAVLRFNFPYMEKGGKRPDSPPLAEAAVRAAVAEAGKLARGLPLFAGGRSFGGRMASGAQSKEPLPNVVGLVFFAFPLHLAGKPATERAKHLSDIKIPMLFLSGSRDPLAELDLLKPTVKKLGARAKLVLAADADHSFHVPAKTGRKDPEVFAELLDAARDWMLKQASGE